MSEMTENKEMPGSVPQQVQEPELPGKRLRAAREAAGLSREEVAVQLRLHVRLITALEENDYDALPGSTFTTGYLRNYARLLELPEDTFITPAQHQPPPLVSTSASVREISSHDGVARLATYAVIGVMIVSVVLWWMGRKEPIEPMENPPAAEIAELQRNRLLSEATQDDEEVLPSPLDSVNSQTDAETTPVQTQAGDASENEQVESDAAVSNLQTEAPAVLSAPVASVTSPAQPEPPPLTDDMPQSKLELRFEADSWTEVKDNAGRQLLYRLIKAGEVLVVRGEAPFHVFLGYAPGVVVYYNDELFDHSAFQRRDVARFRIGRAEHNHPISR